MPTKQEMLASAQESNDPIARIPSAISNYFNRDVAPPARDFMTAGAAQARPPTPVLTAQPQPAPYVGGAQTADYRTPSDQGDVPQTQDSAAGFPDSAAGLPDVAAQYSADTGLDKPAGYAATASYDARERNILSNYQNSSNEAGAQADEAARLQQEYQQARGKREASLDAQRVVAAQRLSDTMGDINQRATEATRTQMARVDAATQAAQNFQFKDFFASRSTLGTIMGILSAGIGGGVNGLQGRAGAPTALDRVIAQDWEQQKAQYGQLENNVQNQRTLYQDLVQQTDNERQAYLAFHNAVTQKFDALGKQIVSSMSDQAAQVNYQMMVAQNAKATVDRNAKFAQIAQQTNATELGAQMRVALARNAVHAAALAKLKQNSESPLRGAGVELGSYSGAEASKVNEQISQGRSAVKLIDEMLADRDLSQDQARGDRLTHFVAGAATQNARALIAKAKSIQTGLFHTTGDAPKGFVEGIGSQLGRVLNRAEPIEDRNKRLREIRAEVLDTLQGQIVGKGGVIAPKLPDGQPNYLYTDSLHQAGWRNYVSQLRGGTLPDKGPVSNENESRTEQANYDPDDE